MAGSPQDVINEQIVDGCDFGIAVFWSRLGTATKAHPSGSAEEVERLRARGANVLVYFCDRAVPQSALGDDQFDKLQALKKDYRDRGLYSPYDTPDDLARRFTLHLTGVVNGHLVKLRAGNQPIPSTGTLTAPTPDIRVKASSVVAHGGGPHPMGAFLRIEIQNHSPNVLFFQDLSFTLDDGSGVMVVQDAFSNERVMPRTIVAGDSYTLLVAPETWKLGERTIKGAVVRDKIDRTYVVDASELATALKSNAETRLVVHKM